MALSQPEAAALMERLQQMEQQQQALAAVVEAQRAEIQAQRALGDQAQNALTAAASQITQLQAAAASQQSQLAAAARQRCQLI